MRHSKESPLNLTLTLSAFKGINLLLFPLKTLSFVTFSRGKLAELIRLDLLNFTEVSIS